MTTRSPDRLEDLKKEFVLSADEDYVDLSGLAWEVADTLGLRSEDETRDVALRLIADLLEDGYIRAGIPTADGGFDVWGEHLVEIVAHIDGEWRRLGRTPELGEVVWFEATEKGEEYTADQLAAR